MTGQARSMLMRRSLPAPAQPDPGGCPIGEQGGSSVADQGDRPGDERGAY